MSVQSVIVVSPQFTHVVYAKLSFCSAQDLDLILVTMTDRELYRPGIIQRVFDRALLQRDAADILELSVSQVQRLVRLYRTDGATAFASSRRGRPANNRINEEIRCKALDLIRCHYSDFGPTLATEKLAERHHIHLSVETVDGRRPLASSFPPANPGLSATLSSRQPRGTGSDRWLSP